MLNRWFHKVLIGFWWWFCCTYSNEQVCPFRIVSSNLNDWTLFKIYPLNTSIQDGSTMCVKIIPTQGFTYSELSTTSRSFHHLPVLLSCRAGCSFEESTSERCADERLWNQGYVGVGCCTALQWSDCCMQIKPRQHSVNKHGCGESDSCSHWKWHRSAAKMLQW